MDERCDNCDFYNRDEICDECRRQRTSKNRHSVTDNCPYDENEYD